MSDQNLKKNVSSRPGQTKKRGKFLVIFSLVVGACLIIGATVWGFSQNTFGSAHISSQQSIFPFKTCSSDVQSDFKDLIGRWIRKDGGYVIEIRSIDANGKMDADYYNPRPINVSVAEASKDNNIVKVFIELRDVGYPGSTYSLAYIPSENMLIGIYYQAKLDQTFEVIFIKME
jgi:hypothetical protein